MGDISKRMLPQGLCWGLRVPFCHLCPEVTPGRADTQVGLGGVRAEARLDFHTRKGARGQDPAAEAAGLCRVVGFSPGTGVSRVPAHPAPHCPPICVATVLQVPPPWHARQLQEPRDRVDPATHSRFRPVSCFPTSPPRQRMARMEGLGAHQPPSVSYAGGGLSGNGTGCRLGPCMAPRPTPAGTPGAVCMRAAGQRVLGVCGEIKPLFLSRRWEGLAKQEQMPPLSGGVEASPRPPPGAVHQAPHGGQSPAQQGLGSETYFNRLCLHAPHPCLVAGALPAALIGA